jgi:hypothetical protein
MTICLVIGLQAKERSQYFLFFPYYCIIARNTAKFRTEMSTRNFPLGKRRQALKADNLTAIYEPIVWKMWERDSVITLHFLFIIFTDANKLERIQQKYAALCYSLFLPHVQYSFANALKHLKRPLMHYSLLKFFLLLKGGTR